MINQTLSRMHIMDLMIFLKCLKFYSVMIKMKCFFFKLYILLYADDTVIFAETKDE